MCTVHVVMTWSTENALFLISGAGNCDVIKSPDESDDLEFQVANLEACCPELFIVDLDYMRKIVAS